MMIFYFLFVCLCAQACRDFLALAQAHSKRWQKALQAEREQRVRLEETLEQLAKQHNHLERAFRGATVLPASSSNTTADIKGIHPHTQTSTLNTVWLNAANICQTFTKSFYLHSDKKLFYFYPWLQVQLQQREMPAMMRRLSFLMRVRSLSLSQLTPNTTGLYLSLFSLFVSHTGIWT